MLVRPWRNSRIELPQYIAYSIYYNIPVRAFNLL